MVVNSQDQIWEATYDTYYDCYYQEIVADGLVKMWQVIDEVTKVLVALTVSGSAVAGWALWSKPEYSDIWAIIAGLASLLTIIHSTLGVPGRLAEWGEIKSLFAGLRINLETQKFKMTIDPQFAVDEITQEFLKIREAYSDGMQRIKNDILRTQNLRVRSQKDLNVRLGLNDTKNT